jgi:hypothetical protein
MRAQAKVSSRRGRSSGAIKLTAALVRTVLVNGRAQVAYPGPENAAETVTRLNARRAGVSLCLVQ